MSTVTSVSPLRAVWIIAQRELLVRLRQRSFIITTVLLVVGVVAGVLVANATTGRTTTYTLGATDAATAAVVEQSAAASGIEAHVTTVAPGDVDRLLRDDDYDAVVEPAPHGLTVHVLTTLDPTLQPLLHGIAQQQVLTTQVDALGGDPAQVSAALAQAGATVEALDPPTERDATQIIAGVVVGIVIYVALMIASQLVAQGVVEEKTSRVVELLLSTVRPGQLMAGKVVGIGLVGLAQVVVTVGAAAIAASRTGLLDTSGIRVGPTLGWALAWFLVGYTTYAIVLAGLASLVSRQEEVGSVITPALMFMILPYVFGVSVLPADPTNQLATTLSLIPGFSPFLMPIREGMGTTAAWEPWLALGLSLAVLPVLVWLAGTVYGNAVLRTGARIKLKDALRRA